MAMRGKKTLSADDRILWGKVARTTNAMPGRMAEIDRAFREAVEPNTYRIIVKP